jgi:hypothetical protein
MNDKKKIGSVLQILIRPKEFRAVELKWEEENRDFQVGQL